MSRLRVLFLPFLLAGFCPNGAAADDPKPKPPAAGDLPSAEDLRISRSELRDAVLWFGADRGSLERFYPVAASSARRERFRRFYKEWLGLVESQDFDSLSRDGQIDYLLFQNDLRHELRQLDIEARALAEAAPLVPFAQKIIDLEEKRRRMEAVDGAKAAATLHGLPKEIEEVRKKVEAGLAAGDKKAGKDPVVKPGKAVANRAAGVVQALRSALREWSDSYNGYDPLFTWWTAEPFKAADQALEQYAAFLRDRVVGAKVGDEVTIIGDPIGREALQSELANEMIPYTPEELVQIANREFAWCEKEMKKASRDLGYRDNWHKALEHVKTLYVEPGKQPELIRKLAEEAADYVEKHDLVTVPRLARETWRMEMMTPQRQLVNPFFTGGEVISVSYPTSTMTHEQKLMSMRGNNIHFSRATVHHELIPGHYLQMFMMERYRTYRRPFGTPFWMEGWALYWETLLWDLGFPKSPENRIGMLFWRMHRCARIIFSLSFHLGKMTPQECIDFLVNRVGHERENAAAEVRRSFNGSYSPLYQCAYMLGALQIRALRREMVDSGKMTNRAFHDAILKENSIPIAMIRADLTGQTLSREFKSEWRFYPAKESK